MAHQEEKLPEWMLRLENKRNKHSRLAHEIGAGSPCLICGDSCPGLDLHFWRKLCRNCKCKKEDHDVKDDEGYEQFEILLGAASKKKKKGGVLKLKVPDDGNNPVVLYEGGSKGLSFDWLPPNVSEEVAAEYMQQLPASKLPISGSDGALYRRQQLEKQVPLHDLDAKHCHNLTPEEIEQLMKYLDNLKNNVVGQGCVGKVPTLYSEGRTTVLGPTAMLAGSQPLGRPLPSSQSADTIRPLPPMPPAYNSAPRPYCPHAPTPASGVGEEDLPPPLPSSLPPRAGLKTPSDFLPDWRLPENATGLGPVADDLRNLTLHPQGGAGSGSHFVKENVPSELAVSSHGTSMAPQFSAALPGQKPPVAGLTLSNPTPSHVAHSESACNSNPEWSTTLGGQPSPAGYASSSLGRKLPESGMLSEGRPIGYVRNALDANKEASGSTVPGSTGAVATFPSDGVQMASLHPYSVANSAVENRMGAPGLSRPLGHDNHVVPGGISSCFNPDGSGLPPAGSLKESMQHATNTIHSTSLPQHGVVGTSAILQGTSKELPAPPIGSHSLPASSVAFLRGSGVESSVPADDLGSPPDPLRVQGVISSNVLPHNVVHSSAIGTDALPKSAHAMQQNTVQVDPSNAGICAGTAAQLPAETPGGSDAPHLDCHECGLGLQAGDVAVFAERASTAAWHPGCFVCTMCKELLVDLMYFYHKGSVYCGRHFADLLGIPRCFACDELIFVKEYTVAEGKAYHVKHFCCYECDEPLGGKRYIPVEEQSVCLECYERLYGKQCHTCLKKIGAGDQRINWKHLNWHVQGNCFSCFECAKSLLGGRFVVKEDRPFCSKECVQAGLKKWLELLKR